MKLEEAQGIGPVTVEKLSQVGIDTLEELEEKGSLAAFLLVREQVDKGACLSFLYGLEGAIQKKRSKELPKETKEELRLFYHSLE